MIRNLVFALALGLSLSVMANPKVVRKIPPEFPGEAVRKNISSGEVKAKLTIEADGKVSNVEILDANPKRIFDRATIDALSQWRFEPGAGQQTVEIKLVFRNDE
ncbi:MAG: energy transducer TonB [Inhella sp.]|jgi:protein TonB|uniref:energy transducer TonB n=2 Tax=Inhella sp. TaxID=1921806 RepID=UPI00391D1B74